MKEKVLVLWISSCEAKPSEVLIGILHKHF